MAMLCRMRIHSLWREMAAVNYKVTLRCPVVERYVANNNNNNNNPYCESLEEIFGELADFWDGEQVEVLDSFAKAVRAGWEAVKQYVVGDSKYISKGEIVGEFRDSFCRSKGGTWGFDLDHGNEFSVKIERTLDAPTPPVLPTGASSSVSSEDTSSSDTS